MLILRIKQLLDVVVWGIPTMIWLLLRNPETVYFIPHIGIGDFCISLGYLETYKSYHNIAHITLVTSKGRKELCEFYSGYDDMLILSGPQYWGLSYLASVPFGRLLCRKCKRIEQVAFVLYVNRALLFDNPSLHAYDCTKMILKIPRQSNMRSPVVPEANIRPFIEKYHLKAGKTVLLNPYTSGISVKQLDKNFYCSLVERLKESGFQTITVLGFPSQEPICGTVGFVTSLAEAWYLAKYCGCVIGTRSGFFDFIQHTGSKIITIYDKYYRQYDFFSIEKHTEDRHVFEFRYDDDYADLVDNIMECVMNTKDIQTA